MKLLFLTVIPSPYQRQLFTALAARGDVDVQVFYFTAGAHDRSWAIPDLHPFETILPGRTLTRLGPSAHWNPGIMDRIAQADPDLVIVSDYSAVTAQVAMRGMARRGRPFVFWGEVPGFSTRGRLGTFLRRQLQAPLDLLFCRQPALRPYLDDGLVVAARDPRAHVAGLLPYPGLHLGLGLHGPALDGALDRDASL